MRPAATPTLICIPGSCCRAAARDTAFIARRTYTPARTAAVVASRIASRAAGSSGRSPMRLGLDSESLWLLASSPWAPPSSSFSSALCSGFAVAPWCTGHHTSMASPANFTTSPPKWWITAMAAPK